MQVTSRFAIAIHTLICIHYFDGQHKLTSDFIAKSTKTNPVIIRRILGQLKKAGLVNILSGIGGSSIAKPIDQISLYDIFTAIEAIEDTLFNRHKMATCQCLIGKNITPILDKNMQKIEDAMYLQMKQIFLSELINDTIQLINSTDK